MLHFAFFVGSWTRDAGLGLGLGPGTWTWTWTCTWNWISAWTCAWNWIWALESELGTWIQSVRLGLWEDLGLGPGLDLAVGLSFGFGLGLGRRAGRPAGWALNGDFFIFFNEFELFPTFSTLFRFSSFFIIS